MSRVPVIAIVIVVLLLAGLGVLFWPSPSAPGPAGSGPRTTVQSPWAHRVLHEWDAARARCWARGSDRCLRRLYLRRSSALAADAALLARWRQRGYRVVGIRRQVLGLEVLAASRKRLVLRVTDRFAGGTARPRRTGSSGAGFRLPGSAARTRVLVLVKQSDGWRMRRVASR